MRVILLVRNVIVQQSVPMVTPLHSDLNRDNRLFPATEHSYGVESGGKKLLIDDVVWDIVVHH